YLRLLPAVLPAWAPIGVTGHMVASTPHLRRTTLLVVLCLVVTSSGCYSLVTRPQPRLVGGQAPDHTGLAVPTEKDKTTLPPYTVEPPDILFIEAIRVVPKPPYHIQGS